MSDNLCYCKVGRAINKWGVIEKCPMKNKPFDSVPKIIMHFGGTNNIFADCICILFRRYKKSPD